MPKKDSLTVAEIQLKRKELEDNIRASILEFIEETGIGIRDVDIQFFANHTLSDSIAEYKLMRVYVTLNL